MKVLGFLMLAASLFAPLMLFLGWLMSLAWNQVMVPQGLSTIGPLQGTGLLLLLTIVFVTYFRRPRRVTS
jgi:hypothetical protein